MTNQSDSTPSRLPAVLAGISAFLATYTAITTRVVTTYTIQDWGLVNRMPVSFWIGLALIGVMMCFANRSSMKCMATVPVLMIVYLFVIPTVVAGHSPDFVPVTYFEYKQAIYFANEGHILATIEDTLIQYTFWPGYLFLSGSLYHLTGIDGMNFVDIMSIFTTSVETLLAFCILRSMFHARSSLWGTTLFIGGLWTTQQQFHPQGIALILFLAFFLMSTKLVPGRMRTSRMASLILLIVIQAALVITHSLTPLIVAVAMMTCYFVSRILHDTAFVSANQVFLVFTVVLVYWVFALRYIFESGLVRLWDVLTGQYINGFSFLLEYGVPTNLYRGLSTFASYLSGALISFPALLGLIGALRNRTLRHRALWTGWSLGVSIPAGLLYGHEGLFRAYLLMLPLLVLLCLTVMSRRPNAVILLALLVLGLHVPAHYGFAGYMRVVTPVEDAGTSFLVSQTPTKSTRLYGANWVPAAWYHDVSVVNTPWFTVLTPPASSNVSIATTLPWFLVLDHDIRSTMRTVEYIADSSLLDTYFVYYIGYNPLRRIGLQESTDLVYNSGGFNISWSYVYDAPYVRRVP